MQLLEEIQALVRKPEELARYIHNLSATTLQPTYSVLDLQYLFFYVEPVDLQLKLLQQLMPRLQMREGQVSQVLSLVQCEDSLLEYVVNHLADNGPLLLCNPWLFNEIFDCVKPWTLKMKLLKSLMPHLQIQTIDELNAVLRGLRTHFELQDHFLRYLKLDRIHFRPFTGVSMKGVFQGIMDPELRINFFIMILPTFNFQDGEELASVLNIIKSAGVSKEEQLCLIRLLQPEHCAHINLSSFPATRVLDRKYKSVQDYLLFTLEEILNVPEPVQNYLLSILPQQEVRRCLSMARPYQDAKLYKKLGQYFVSSLDFCRHSSHFLTLFSPNPVQEEIGFSEEEAADIKDNRVKHRGY